MILVYQGHGLFALIMIISGPNSAFYECLSLSQVSTIIQSLFIMNGLHQLFQGRFCLKKNQIAGIYNAHFFTMMFPCNF